MDFKNGIINIQAAGYNGPHTVNWWDNQGLEIKCHVGDEEAVKKAHTFLMSFNEAIIYAKR